MPQKERLFSTKGGLFLFKTILQQRKIEVIDKDGNVVPLADNERSVTVSGNATLQALGNADIKDEDPYFDSVHRAWKGTCVSYSAR